MSKIIIHNNSKLSDLNALRLVRRVIADGYASGEKQYCWLSSFIEAQVHAKPTRGTTHTFEVRDIE